MARFEITINNGEKILVEHPSTSFDELALEFSTNPLMLFKEIKPGSSVPPIDVMVKTSEIALVRPIGEGMMGSQFRGKRSA